MKKTLAIVLAVLLAVAALSSFAFIVGSSTQADFELRNIYAVDIDLTKAGLQSYQEIVASKDYWTKDKSLAIAVEFRVWNRTLDGHAGVQVGDTYQIKVSSTTADMSFCQYAVTKAASYVDVLGTRQLSYVAECALGTVNKVTGENAATFSVRAVTRVPYSASTLTTFNVINAPIIGTSRISGYIPNTAGGAITIPALTYGMDPSYVDYVVFLSAKHLAPNAENLGDLSACFRLSAAEGWRNMLSYNDTNREYYLGSYNLNDLTLAAINASLVKNGYYDSTDGLLDGAGLQVAPDFTDMITLASQYYDTTVTLAEPVGTNGNANLLNTMSAPRNNGADIVWYNGTTTDPCYTEYLVLAGAGYVVLRMDGAFMDGTTPLSNFQKYDVFRFNAQYGFDSMTYVASFTTECLLTNARASALYADYNGAMISRYMLTSYTLNTGAAIGEGVFDWANGDVWGMTRVAANYNAGLALDTPLSSATMQEANYIGAMQSTLAAFGMGIDMGEGWPILDSQFLSAAAKATWSEPIANTYLAGQTAAIEVVNAVEDTEAPPEDVDGDDIIDDGEIDLPPAGDATIAFVCAAAAILACAALAFVMKKAR